MVAMVLSPSSFAIPLIIQKTPILKLEFPKSKRTIIVKKVKFCIDYLIFQERK